jgi:hypothetical protein
MSKWLVVCLAVFLGFGVACQSKPAPSEFNSTATPPSSGTAPSFNSTPEPTVEYAISRIPLCQGLEALPAPLQFDWPDKEAVFEKLADHTWGYYRCSIPQPGLAAFYAQKMVRPPYNWQQVAWLDNSGGSVVLYYSSLLRVWIYLWLLPGPDKTSSYLVVSKSDPGAPQGWDCD